ncbi:MAG: prolyl aminopeptidase [Alphaproteobacteria bacterium]|nr:MAG: prolyl aminopeptidase [Alphaproteobacteria bacterium]
MDRSTTKDRLVDGLYPPARPTRVLGLDVGEGHRLHIEEYGNPAGLPVIVLHGGPGGGCSPAMARYFAPDRYRAVLFDQRGCGRSTPHASVEANTTWHLVADIERIRAALGIERWIVFGGSWGATLALLYAEAHPERVLHLVLRGVFLMRQEELDWFYRGGAARFFPEEWARFLAPLPPEARGDPIMGYHAILFGADERRARQAARHWTRWENALASMNAHLSPGDAPDAYARAFARLENHYFFHGGFLRRDDQILAEAGRIRAIPGSIVQGRYDVICPPKAAWDLAEAWPAADLEMVPNAGHALSEPPIGRALRRIMDEIATDRRPLAAGASGQ